MGVKRWVRVSAVTAITRFCRSLLPDVRAAYSASACRATTVSCQSPSHRPHPHSVPRNSLGHTIKAQKTAAKAQMYLFNKSANVQSIKPQLVPPKALHRQWRFWPEILIAYFKIRPLTENFSKFCSERIHRDADSITSCVQLSWNLTDVKSVKSRVAYLAKKKQKFASLSRSSFCADGAQNLPGSVADNVLRVLQILSKSVHFRWSYSRTREHRWNAR